MDLSADTVFQNIWARDKLDRRGYADFLYKVIESAKTSEAEDNALIFAIDGEWGTGKSFFIDCWIEDLRSKGHLVSRFDAWKNDIVDEPLIGFLSHIYADLGEWDKYNFLEVAGDDIKKSQKNILPLAKELVKGAAIKGLGYLVTDDVAKDISKSVLDGCEKVAADQEKDEQAMSAMLIHRKLQAHNKNLQLIEEFKSKLSSIAQGIVADRGKRSPVFIFIDELDRCRPDYAVRLLEVVKHIFNSKGICFISSVNINQLQQSIKTIYGEKFEADRYLDRFFSHRLKLPSPSTKDFINSLMVFNVVKDNKSRLNAGTSFVVREFDEKFIDYFVEICEICKFDLRTIKSLFGRLEVCRGIFISVENNFFHDEILFFILCYLKFKNENKSHEANDIFSDNYFINNLKGFMYYYYDYSYGKNTLKSCSWEFLLKVINNIIQKYGVFTPHFQSREIDDLQEALMDELGGKQQGLKVATAKIKWYVDVCQMSGRLDN